MKSKKIKSVAYEDPCVGKASAQFKKVYLDTTTVIVPEIIKTSFDSLVSEVRPLQGQGLKKPSMEI